MASVQCSWVRGRVVVVDRTGKRLVQTFENGFDDVFRLAFSPDGSLLACASSNHTIKTWDLSTGQERVTLRIPDGPGLEPYVTALEFSQNSRELFSGHFQGRARIWDLAAGTSSGTVELWDLTSDPPVHVASLVGHASSVTSVAFSRDGSTIVSLSDDSLRTWHSAPHAHQPR